MFLYNKIRKQFSIKLLIIFIYTLTWFQSANCQVTFNSATTYRPRNGEVNEEVYEICMKQAQEDILDCDEDWRDRLEDDLNDREECCAFVEFRNCVKEAIEDACDDNYPEEVWDHQVYGKWRNETNRKHPHLSLRCWDDASDSFECIILNNLGFMITMLTLTIIFIVLWCILTAWLIYSRGTWRKTLTLSHR